MADVGGCFGKMKKNYKSSTDKVQHKSSRILLGDLKKVDARIRRFYELALPENLSKCGRFFQLYKTAESPEKLRFESQTFPQWKIQKDFQKLHFRQRKRMKRRRIYILPIGPYPEFVLEKIPGLQSSLFELICHFVSVFYLWFSVELLNSLNIDEISCQTRVHQGTGKRQILVGDVLTYLKRRLPNDGYCIVGITWEDLYPGDEWNFVLGEASLTGDCAALSFGHYEPNASQKLQPILHDQSHKAYSEYVIYTSTSTNEVGPTHSNLDSSITSPNSNNERNTWEISIFNSSKLAQNSQELCLEPSKIAPRNTSIDMNNPDFLQHHSRTEHLASNRQDVCESKSENSKDLNLKMDKTINQQDVCTSRQVNACSDVTEDISGRIKRIDAFQVWKFFRVISHELGHVFGITHCTYFTCAMNESSSINEAVGQTLFMCPVCLRKIQKATGFDVVERYTGLKLFLENLYSDFNKDRGKTKIVYFDKSKSPGTGEDTGPKDLERFSKAINWIDSVLEFLHTD